MDDVRTVMDEVGSERAVVMGANEGTMMAALFAATYPDRVTALVLANATARPGWAPDNPLGIEPEVVEALVESVDETWGRGLDDGRSEPERRRRRPRHPGLGAVPCLAASPAVAAAVLRMIFELDVRAILPTIRVPTLVVSRRDAFFPGASGRAVAELVPGAEFVEVPGADYGLALGDVDPVIDEIEEFVTGSRPSHDADRVLATVLFTDIVESTRRAAQLGDRGGRTLLDAHNENARREVSAHGGLIADFAGMVSATFDVAPCGALRARAAGPGSRPRHRDPRRPARRRDRTTR